MSYSSSTPIPARGKVTAIVGAQYGSEGKGNIVNHLAPRYDVHVRVGGPNAGHSFYHGDRLFKMQGIPCGWTNPDAHLYIGRGALVSPQILRKELMEVQEVDPTIWDRLHIDSRAGVLSLEFKEAEGGVEGELHQRIGSTGEGVGAAREARMRRNPDRFVMFGDIADYYGMGKLVTEDTPERLSLLIRSGHNVLLEGTQGQALSLIHGPWPYVTSHDTGAAQMLADAGISPRWLTGVLLVARTMPIRVAGNSGPLKDETTWEAISDFLGHPVLERTTVTKKVRRVGGWDEDLVRRAVAINAPTAMAITFMDYLNPKDEGITDLRQMSDSGRAFLDYVLDAFATPVALIGTGGPRWSVIEPEWKRRDWR